MIRRDLHIHTTYCDGDNTPRELVQAAYEAGMEAVGFAGHSFTWYDPDFYCMTEEKTKGYIDEINGLKEEYKDKIEVLLGIEMDMYSLTDPSPYDFIIGSLHYLKTGGFFAPVDENPVLFRFAAEEYFDGDYYAFAEEYFRQVSHILDETGADIIGHFDIISKFNEKHRFFDENHPRYIKAWKDAADHLIPYGKPFEINTGGMYSDWRSVPYPAPAIMEYIRERGGKLILSSDAHSTKALCHRFDQWESFTEQPRF